MVQSDRFLFHINAVDAPRHLQRRLDARAVEGEQRDDRLGMRRIGIDQPVAIPLGQEAYPFVVERDCLDLDRRQVVQFMMHVDRRLKHGAVAILTGRIVTGQISAAELLPRLLRFAQGAIADQAVELADAQDVRGTRRLGLRQVTFEGIRDRALRDDRRRAEHQLTPQLRFVFGHQVRCSIRVTRS